MIKKLKSKLSDPLDILEVVDDEEYLGAMSNPVNIQAHYQMLRELDFDILELRRELLGLSSIRDVQLLKVKQQKLERKQHEEGRK